ncbi:hypothetical protein BDY24DRAFT_411436 [Mrakia frigida]|uniref:RlpA-like double-psi beta-barrel domain-containing protein n=1 Tax=Mrakia frigida TaxID=29902 RepID=UPI003FCC1ED3
MLSNKLALLVVLASTIGLATAAPSPGAVSGKRFNKARLNGRQHGEGNRHGGGGQRPGDVQSEAVASSTSSSVEEQAQLTTAAAVATTTAAAASTTTAASSSGSGTTYSGVATYFLQGGNAGACGNVNDDSALIVAIPTTFWGDDSGSASSYCGSQMVITAASTGQTVTVTVADLCPTCVGADSIDLSVGAISALAGSTDYTQEGQYDVTWQWA